MLEALASVLDGNAGSASGLESIIAAIAGQPTLILLDNCEHVIEAAADLVDTLSKRAPNLTVLATSRERLDVPDEFVYRIEGIDSNGLDSDAVTLFVRRAEAATGYEDRPDYRDLVHRIVDKLEGLPLAIELAAARLSTMSLSELLDALDNQLETLRSGRRSRGRKNAIDAAIAWSFDLLQSEEKSLVLALAVFAAPFTASAAEAVGSEQAVSASHALPRLVEQSVVVRRERKGYSRYRLLEPIRQFCLARIEPSDHDAAQLRHANYFAQRAKELARGIDGEGELAAAEALNAEWPDLREAFALGRRLKRPELAIDPIVAMSRTILFHLRSEAYRWLIDAEHVFGEIASSRADVNAVIANGHWVMGNPELCEEYIQRADAILVTPTSLRAKYFLRFSQNRFDESADAALKAERLSQEIGDRVEMRWWANAFRVCPLTMANPNDPRVDEKLAASIAAIECLDWPTGKAFLSMARGTVAITRRDLANAYLHMSNAIDVATTCGNRWIQSVSGLIANSVADPSIPAGDRLRSAIEHLKQLVEMGEETHYPLAVRAIVTDLVDCGNEELAARCSGIVDRLHGVGDKNEFSPRYPETLTTLQERLGPERLGQLQSASAHLSIDAVVELAESASISE